MAELEARVKEERVCINCNDSFLFHYPLGQAAGFVNPNLKEGEIDTWTLCRDCSPLLCSLCKKTMCNSAEEMTAKKCHGCPDEKCLKCHASVRHQASLVHKLCLACFEKSVCTQCNLYSSTCLIRGSSKLCQQCITCSACSNPLPTEAEQQAQMCTSCIEMLEDN